MYPFIFFLLAAHSGLLTLRWPFGQYFYVIACRPTSMPLLVDELNK